MLNQQINIYYIYKVDQHITHAHEYAQTTINVNIPKIRIMQIKRIKRKEKKESFFIHLNKLLLERIEGRMNRLSN